MQISISDYYSQSSSIFSSTATYGTSSTSFADLLFGSTDSSSNTVSFAEELSLAGAESIGPPPDFSSMTTDEFLEHLLEVQSTLASMGVDTSSMTDPTSLSVDELEALQAEMSSKGKDGMPPPPPPSQQMTSSTLMMGFNFDDYSDLSGETLEALFGVA